MVDFKGIIQSNPTCLVTVSDDIASSNISEERKFKSFSEGIEWGLSQIANPLVLNVTIVEIFRRERKTIFKWNALLGVVCPVILQDENFLSPQPERVTSVEPVIVVIKQ